MKLLMASNAVLALLFALGFLLVPGRLLAAYGTTADAALVQMARFFGAAMLGYALLTWLARGAGPSRTRRDILLALALSFAVGFLVALQGQISGVVNRLGWLTVAVYLLYTLGYGYFLLADRES
jgi:hypothetical protein